ncbi:MAG: amidohydrolase [Bacteroidia bacterium]|nr:amidohydrolase [Bacteroidia bacterium]NND26747.1 amidohydrolase [Flavobacteriaceae bacterium]NNK61327.1 amidohydrolase [Flavobacteriaceae bacterium]NNL34173.1 amidohydrolase [Flavobacteriaceae bacterium]
MKYLVLVGFLFSIGVGFAQHGLDKDIEKMESKVIEWRRDFHQHPELSNREFKTAEKIAAHLRSLGMEVQTGIAHTGVVGLLKGNQPGKVLALRADIDALPVPERADLPFKSTATGTFRGEEVPVMHACGHDTHIAILMGVAEIMAKNKDKIKGTIKFIFQPAEEGAPPGEKGGAKMMVEEGVLKNPDVDAIFGLHIGSAQEVNTIAYKSGGIMAAVNSFEINVSGKQTHGSMPWGGVDPIMASVKIIDGLQTLVSREMPLTNEAVVLSIGKISSGVRSNIIPESAQIIGTLRTLDADMQAQIHKRMREMVPAIAKAYRAEATIHIDEGYPITYNDPALTAQMLPSLKAAAGEDKVFEIKAITGAEDFSFFQKEVPGLYFFLGGKAPDATEVFPHHTPDFYIDESGLLLGVKTFVQLSFDYLNKE